MKYFKHMADASDDDFIEELERQFDLEGYARWWKMLEVIAAAMEKDRNDPSAKHLVSKWCEKLKAKKKVLANFLEFCLLKKKIKVFFFDQETTSFRECSGNVPGMFQQSNHNIMKITCPNMLKLRDEYSRRYGETPERLAQEAEAVSKKKENPLTPLPVDNFVKEVNNDLPIPVPKLSERKKVFNENDFAAAAAACCSILDRRMLAPSDSALLLGWLQIYDFKGFILPIMIEKTEKYCKKNIGKRPVSLEYFKDALHEKYKES